MKHELYRFVENSTVYTYTSGDKAVVYDAGEGDETYTPRAMGRNEVESKPDLAKATMNVNFLLDDTVARRWMNDRLETVISLTLFEKDENGDIAVQWKGRMSGSKPSAAEIVLSFESIFTSLRRPGLRARMLRNCRHSLFGRGCKLDAALFAFAATATAASGFEVTVPGADAQPDGTYTTGMLEAPDGTFRFIVNHVGSTLTLIRPINSLIQAITDDGDQDVTLYPGCDRSRQTCNDKFNNLERYGGFDWIPTRNPFDGSSII